MSLCERSDKRGIAIILDNDEDILRLYAAAVASDFELETLITFYDEKLASLRAAAVGYANLRTLLINTRDHRVQTLQLYQQIYEAIPGARVSLQRRASNIFGTTFQSADTILNQASLLADGVKEVSNIAGLGKALSDSLTKWK